METIVHARHATLRRSVRFPSHDTTSRHRIAMTTSAPVTPMKSRFHKKQKCVEIEGEDEGEGEGETPTTTNMATHFNTDINNDNDDNVSGKALIERRRSSRVGTTTTTTGIDLIKTPEHKPFVSSKHKRKSFTATSDQMMTTMTTATATTTIGGGSGNGVAQLLKQKMSEQNQQQQLPLVSTVISCKSKRDMNEEKEGETGIDDDESSEAVTPTIHHHHLKSQNPSSAGSDKDKSGEQVVILPPSIKLQHREAKRRKRVELRLTRPVPSPSCVRSLFSSTSHNVMPTLEELKVVTRKAGVVRE